VSGGPSSVLEGRARRRWRDLQDSPPAQRMIRRSGNRFADQIMRKIIS
jgi:hypothetical protein